MIREHSVLYSAPMIIARKEGRKSMTRRLHGLDEINREPDRWKLACMAADALNGQLSACFVHGAEAVWVKCPWGNVGDRLTCHNCRHVYTIAERDRAIADSYQPERRLYGGLSADQSVPRREEGDECGSRSVQCPSCGSDVEYEPSRHRGSLLWSKETLVRDEWGAAWRYAADCQAVKAPPEHHVSELPEICPSGSLTCPSIFQPRWTSRFLDEITEIGMARVESISEEDAVREGFETRGAFLDLFYKLNAKKIKPGQNPWAWGYGFKPLEVGS